MPSLSRQFARWIVGLRFDDLPPDVVDRAKGVTLHTLASVLLGSKTAVGKRAVKLVVGEEAGVRKGATILVDGSTVTKGGAAFANSEMAFAGAKLDSFRMLTHPGSGIIPGAFAAAEATGASGREFITSLVAGYEVMERMAADFIPTVMARGFHAGPVFGIFGAAVAAAKILRLSENEVNSAIALCASLAAGNLEGARSGGRSLREGPSVRNALLAVALAQDGHKGGESVLEGDAGFYHAYAGNNKGLLTHSFTGDTVASLDKITANLGKEWMFLETLYRIYSISGYNLAHIDVTAKLCAENDIHYGNIERIEAVVNWLETEYPSPAFPSRREYSPPKIGDTAYYTAYGAVRRSFPMLLDKSDPAEAHGPPEVLDLMKRVTVIPSHNMKLFAPKITIFTKDHHCYTRQATGEEFIWDYNEEAHRIRPIASELPISTEQFATIIEVCRNLDQHERADLLINLTLNTQNATPKI